MNDKVRNQRRGKPAFTRLVGTISRVTIVAILTLAARPALASFWDGFESYNAGVTVAGQGGWFASGGSNTNSLVLNNPAIAFAGNQYLSLAGNRPDPAADVRNQSFFGQPIDDVNSNYFFSYAVRFETPGQFGLNVLWDGDSGSAISQTRFSATGEIEYYTNGYFSGFVDGGVAIAPGQWYVVNQRAFPSKQDLQYSVIRASDNAVIFNQIIPQNTPSHLFTTVNGVELLVDNDTGNHWLIDNMMIVPEPSAPALLAMYGLVCLWRCRKRS